LLGIETPVQLEKSPFLGPIFEGFIAGEMAKAQLNAGRRRELYYFRDQQILEVDFIVPTRGGGVRLVEAKAARTVTPRATPRRCSDWRQRGAGKGAIHNFSLCRAFFRLAVEAQPSTGNVGGLAG
jgi:hypothetical protein